MTTTLVHQPNYFAPVEVKQPRPRWGGSRNPRTPKEHKGRSTNGHAILRRVHKPVKPQGEGVRVLSPGGRATERMIRMELRDWEGLVSREAYMDDCNPQPEPMDDYPEDFREMLENKRQHRLTSMMNAFCAHSFDPCTLNQTCKMSRDCAEASRRANHIAPAPLPPQVYRDLIPPYLRRSA